jgi:YVTN family beta-propeller protein
MTTTISSSIPEKPFCFSHLVFFGCLTAIVFAATLTGCSGISSSSTARVSPSPTPIASPTPTPNANATTTVYATDGSGSLFIFNPKDQSMVSVSVPGAPAGIAVTPDGSMAYITEETADSVEVLDIRQRMVLGHIAVGSMPMAVAVSPDGRFAYVANANSGTVSVIDTASSTVVNTINTDSAPWTLAFSADGAQVYVTLLAFDGAHIGGPHPENTTVVIDAASQTISKKIPLVTGSSLAASPTRPEMYLVGGGFGVAVIDTNTNEVVSQISLDNGDETAVAVSADGKLIYTTEHGMIDIGHEVPPLPTVPSTVYVISADQRAPIAKAQTDPGLIAIALSPDGNTAYLLEDETSFAGMRTMDTHALTFTSTQPLAGNPMRIAVSAH